MSKKLPETAINTSPKGFDAPVFKLADDHLSRWPLACQIYNVAANGPEDWSARIGVYGEWGTGKTSVLKFVESMANRDGHIVIWFDPWGYSSKPDLWQAFVLKCCEGIEGKIGGVAAAGKARTKSYLKGARDWLTKLATSVPSDAGTIATGGMGLLQGAFAFGPADLEALRADLKGRRVFVLIDDLDRTAAELVPEILYALKEVLDIPGFSFVCGFDPIVVGQVLGASHKGFGDGLKFLEKIIDYPVWLPPATSDGLMKIALTDAANYCPFVPQVEIQKVFSLLPQNPRAIRQFIRLLSLLKSQIVRRYVWELRWAVILAANVIKIRYPKLSSQLLNDSDFWSGISMSKLMSDTSNDDDNTPSEIALHIQKSARKQSMILGDEEKEQIRDVLRFILHSLELWTIDDVAMIRKQMSIAETPEAVTWKEFDVFLVDCRSGLLLEKLKTWIVTQADAQHCDVTDVSDKLTKLALARYRSELQKAEHAFTPRQKGHHRKNSKVLMKLIEVLALRIATVLPALGSQVWLDLENTLKSLVVIASSDGPVHIELWPRTEKFLLELVTKWRGSLETLYQGVRSIHPRQTSLPDVVKSGELALRLNEIVDHRLAKVAVSGFSESAFLERVSYNAEITAEIKRLFLDSTGPLWTDYREKVLAKLREAKSNTIVRENAYVFLRLIDSTSQSGPYDFREAAKKLAGEPDIIIAIWKAATVVPFEGYPAYRLRNFPAKVKGFGVDLPIPTWWQPAIDSFSPPVKKDETSKEEKTFV